MKKILLLFLFLFVSAQKAYCQKYMWGLPPEEISELCSNRYELISQEVKASYISLTYRQKPGLLVSFLFENEHLNCIVLRANPSLVSIKTPAGEKKTTTNGESAWYDYEQNCMTRREYHDGLTIDFQIPIESPQ